MQKRLRGCKRPWRQRVHCPPPGFTLKLSVFISFLWKSARLLRERRHKLSPVTKSQLSLNSFIQRSPCPRIVHLRRIFHIWVSERAGAAVWRHSQACQTNAYIHGLYLHESWAFFLSCVWIGIWRGYGFQMGFKMHPCLYRAICELPTLYLFRKSSFIGPEVP